MSKFNARIKVAGAGGGGCNAVSHMYTESVNGVELLAFNTDVQALEKTRAHKKIQIGRKVTRGMGCGADPEIGEAAALESMDAISQAIEDTDMLLIGVGLGGGTGTGAAPVIARVARDMGILTVGVGTTPFKFEGEKRLDTAKAGIIELGRYVDTYIEISNQRLLEIAEELVIGKAFEMVNEVLRQTAMGIITPIAINGIINLDFADIAAIMNGGGRAHVGIGEADGPDRAIEAAEAAINNPLLENSVEGAKSALINIVGGGSLTLSEVNAAARIINQSADEDANIIFGASIDEDMGGKISITAIMTDFPGNKTKKRSISSFLFSQIRDKESSQQSLIF